MRLLVSAGGTGGGVYPALAVVDALEEDVDVLWIGEEGGMAADLIRMPTVQFETVPAAGVHGVGLRRLPSNLWKLLQGFVRARKLIRSFNPDVLFFTGGYAGIPVALAGLRRKITAYVPDIEPALALKIIIRLADWTAVTTDETRNLIPSGKPAFTSGYPVRRMIREMDRAEAMASLRLSGEVPVLLVFGGSKGARSLNRALWNALPEILGLAEVVHITGSLDWPQLDERMPSLTAEQSGLYHPHEYLHDEMAAALQSADLVVSRAGASILGEFPAVGVASILVPYPHAWRYQRMNAAFLVDHGASVVIDDERLEEELLETITDLIADPDRLKAMARSAGALDRPRAARQIADKLLSTMGGSP